MIFAAVITGPQSAPLATSAAHAAPLDEAIAHYATVESYRVTISASHAGSGGEHIVYYYRKPGFVRMEFISPHSGALLIYSPRTKLVRLWPFGYGHFPELHFNPENPLILASGGQHLDRSDVGVLFGDMHALQMSGGTRVLGEETMDGRAVLHLLTTGADDFTVTGVHQYELWLDSTSLFPVKVISRDKRGAVMETVTMGELQVNPGLPETMFNP